jgi:amino acid adenylation domain-containing protein
LRTTRASSRVSFLAFLARLRLPDRPMKFPPLPTVHALYEQQAAATPHAIALVCGDQELSYSGLNERANRLAHHLIRLGVERGQRVAICLERSTEMIVALLGVVKAGGAYVPLDPTHPDDRLDFILRDSSARWCLSHSLTTARLIRANLPAQVVCVSASKASIDSEPEHDPEQELTGDDLIYVMYTSGSTGRPKGVLICHRGVARLVRQTDYCRFAPDEVFLQMAPLAFDASTFEIWGALLNGSRLVMMPPGVPTLAELESTLRRYGVTTLWLTAGLFHIAVEQRVEIFAELRQLLAGGDVLSPGHVKKALEAMHDGVLINGYGPTECTTFACCFRMAKDYSPAASIPIGRPIARTTVHVLDEQMQRVKTGAPGELHIGGEGLADGYLNNEELTRERFVADPFSDDPASRLYRTGDQVRELPDGNIAFLGRFDHQVKIRGHRIELGEIETILRSHPEIRQAAVVAQSDGHAEKQLVAYVVSENRTAAVVNEWKRYLALSLPHYMIPAHFVILDSLPLNSNGKVDRASLPAPTQEFHVDVASGTAGIGLEDQIAALWSRILHRPVGRDENFFDLGGSSLQLIEMHAELANICETKIRLVELFEHATIRSLAAHLSGPNAAATPPSTIAARARLQREAFSRQSRKNGAGR